MDNDQLLNELQRFLEDSERRLAIRLDTIDKELMEVRDGMRQIRAAQVTALQSTVTFMEWAQRTDEGVSGLLKRIATIERQLRNPPAA